MRIFQAFRRSGERREFSKFVPPEHLATAMQTQHAERRRQSEAKHFQYVLVHIREADPEDVAKLIAKVVDILVRHSAFFTDITSSLVVCCLGIPFAKDDSLEARGKLVAALLGETGNAIRIAHGACDGLVGNFGIDRHMKFGAIIPEFSSVLKSLFEIEFGTAIEIS
jgi:hypothetical protein